MNRRTFLAGGLGMLGLAAAGCSSGLPAGVPDIAPGRMVSGSFVSAERGGAVTFDDAADFAAHRIFGRQRRLRGIALRIDCGAADGFAPTVRDLRASISPTPAGGIEPGGHDAKYWLSQAPAQLRFVGRHLG